MVAHIHKWYYIQFWTFKKQRTHLQNPFHFRVFGPKPCQNSVNCDAGILSSPQYLLTETEFHELSWTVFSLIQPNRGQGDPGVVTPEVIYLLKLLQTNNHPLKGAQKCITKCSANIYWHWNVLSLFMLNSHGLKSQDISNDKQCQHHVNVTVCE